MERESSESGSNQAYFIVQKNNSNFDDCASKSNVNDSMDALMLNEEFFMFCENFLEKYKLLKNMSLKMTKEMSFCLQG